MRRTGPAILLFLLLGSGVRPQNTAGRPVTYAIDAALDYLSAEVPAWREENGCFSCHNDGDGARALYVARQKGWFVPDVSLERTTGWLTAPERWEDQPGEAGVKDLRLSQIQFAAALQEAAASGIDASGALRRARADLLVFQRPDGSWADPNETLVGSPATYGAPLGTFMALSVVRRGNSAEATSAALRAASWLLAHEPVSTLDYGARLLGLQLLDEPAARRREAAGRLIALQASSGGWGPYAGAPAEVFDTAIAVIGLSAETSTVGGRSAIEKGVSFLIREQLPTGGWAETTRPSGGESYAQHVSTTAWATLALLAISESRGGSRKPG